MPAVGTAPRTAFPLWRKHVCDVPPSGSVSWKYSFWGQYDLSSAGARGGGIALGQAASISRNQVPGNREGSQKVSICMVAVCFGTDLGALTCRYSWQASPADQYRQGSKCRNAENVLVLKTLLVWRALFFMDTPDLLLFLRLVLPLLFLFHIDLIERAQRSSSRPCGTSAGPVPPGRPQTQGKGADGLSDENILSKNCVVPAFGPSMEAPAGWTNTSCRDRGGDVASDISLRFCSGQAAGEDLSAAVEELVANLLAENKRLGSVVYRLQVKISVFLTPRLVLRRDSLRSIVEALAHPRLFDIS